MIPFPKKLCFNVISIAKICKLSFERMKGHFIWNVWCHGAWGSFYCFAAIVLTLHIYYKCHACVVVHSDYTFCGHTLAHRKKRRIAWKWKWKLWLYCLRSSRSGKRQRSGSLDWWRASEANFFSLDFPQRNKIFQIFLAINLKSF